MTQTAIDFFSGSHGNFLEYCINRYIYKTSSFADLLLTSQGTSHGLKQNKEYVLTRQAESNHYSEFDLPAQADNIIRIVVTDFKGYCCYQLNVINRAGDISAEQKSNELPDAVLNSPCQLRNYYYSKLNNLNDGYQLPGNWKYSGFDFEMSSMYCLESFLHSLKLTADYLNLTFVPDRELGELWQKFIAKNHGLQIWKKCQKQFEQIFSNANHSIDLDIQHQALLNCLISRSVGMHDGAMFNQDQYPQTTQQLYQHIQQHLDTFDSRFD